jgi:hypothetical protein
MFIILYNTLTLTRLILIIFGLVDLDFSAGSGSRGLGSSKPAELRSILSFIMI